MKVGEYFYKLRGRGFQIYQCDYSDGRTEASSPVYDEPCYFTNREEAKKRVYELNGWNYKPQNNGSNT